jgi:mRNA-degrading endonuclease toxin of MazEF toxin-antitoxin module
MIYTWKARITLNGRDSKAMADQIRTLPKARPPGLAGVTSRQERAALENALRFQLEL